MMNFSTTLRSSTKLFRAMGSRQFSKGHSQATEVAEAARWFQVSIVMYTLCFAVGAYNFFAHEHEHARRDMPYLKIRSKPFPWKECSDCDIFDGECWDECRGKGKSAGHDEHHH